ncbi:hypothetical protein EX30DRAFT_243607 [Ascodesmis nigricans]|uniref:Uncharacterized protein n=1 Tax=Ascodesmis nigricans TaxID=341454 RepID=A0A4S2MI92_9PEZI|nr:hypothetical protein EX30DRAFT_243607 [Ascodesmis nigricans]
MISLLHSVNLLTTTSKFEFIVELCCSQLMWATTSGNPIETSGTASTNDKQSQPSSAPDVVALRKLVSIPWVFIIWFCKVYPPAAPPYDCETNLTNLNDTSESVFSRRSIGRRSCNAILNVTIDFHIESPSLTTKTRNQREQLSCFPIGNLRARMPMILKLLGSDTDQYSPCAKESSSM